MTRRLFCPVCGFQVNVLTNGQLPEVHVIPEHVSAIPEVNLCSALVVTVMLAFELCNGCGCNISKHPSGLCAKCFRQERTAP